jgi:hypothetical protein
VAAQGAAIAAIADIPGIGKSRTSPLINTDYTDLEMIQKKGEKRGTSGGA